MVREQFDDAFERMRDQANKLAATERTTDNFDEIVAERVELDRLRHEVTDARKNVVSRFEPPAPDLVEPPRGPQHTKLIGKVGAAIAVALLAVAGFFAYSLVRNIGAGFPVYIGDVTETLDTSENCQWRIETIVRNDSNKRVRVERVETVLNRRFVGGLRGFFPDIPPGESAPLTATWGLGRAQDCASSVDDVNHGNLILHLDNGITVSHGF